jgi:hypothetical protein
LHVNNLVNGKKVTVHNKVFKKLWLEYFCFFYFF